MSAPVSRLRWIQNTGTGERVDPGCERAECLIDVQGRESTWRLWTNVFGRWSHDGRWHERRETAT